jgi:hypothetical protein
VVAKQHGTSAERKGRSAASLTVSRARNNNTQKQTKSQPHVSRDILILANDIYKCNDGNVISKLPIPIAQWFNSLKHTGSSH